MVIALITLRRKAVRLRKAGLPYSSIRKRLRVSKSTLSYWLRDIELTPEQRRSIELDWVARRVETYRETVHRRIQTLEQQRLAEARISLGKITKRDLLIAGLFLYLGEGLKGNRWAVGISNSDPGVIRFAVRWLTRIMGTSRERLRIRLHLYKDMDAQKETAFWSKISGVPLAQFGNPYIKNSLLSSIDYHTHGHGTCNVLVGNGPIKQRIMAEIKTVLDSLNMRP